MLVDQRHVDRGLAEQRVEGGCADLRPPVNAVVIRRLLQMLITPLGALRPYSVPCGPFSTSTWRTSRKAPNTEPTRDCGNSSTVITTPGSAARPKKLKPTPRILIDVDVGSPLVMVRPGVMRVMSWKSTTCAASSCSPVLTIMEMGTRCSFSPILRAYTTTSSRAPSLLSWLQASGAHREVQSATATMGGSSLRCVTCDLPRYSYNSSGRPQQPGCRCTVRSGRQAETEHAPNSKRAKLKQT